MGFVSQLIARRIRKMLTDVPELSGKQVGNILIASATDATLIRVDVDGADVVVRYGKPDIYQNICEVLSMLSDIDEPRRVVIEVRDRLYISADCGEGFKPVSFNSIKPSKITNYVNSRRHSGS